MLTCLMYVSLVLQQSGLSVFMYSLTGDVPARAFPLCRMYHQLHYTVKQ